jgi:hypothetical protein
MTGREGSAIIGGFLWFVIEAGRATSLRNTPKGWTAETDPVGQIVPSSHHVFSDRHATAWRKMTALKNWSKPHGDDRLFICRKSQEGTCPWVTH